MASLLVMSIGPVQEFIATARRCRDLWFGSWLLSELSKAAARSLYVQEGDGALIFPAFGNEAVDLTADSASNVANKVVALIKNSPKEVAEAAYEAMQKRLQALSQSAFSALRNNPLFYQEIADRQLADVLEYYWAAVPLEGDYNKARSRAEDLLAGRKNTRDFNAVQWGDYVPKSSLDGQRESVIDERAYDEARERKAEPTGQAGTLRSRFGVNGAERLCGVGLLKRLGRGPSGTRAENFFSTSHTASLPLLERMRQLERSGDSRSQRVHETVQEYRRFLQEATRETGAELGYIPRQGHPLWERWDGGSLLEERLTEYVGEDRLEEAKKHLRRVYQALEMGGVRPAPYYGILLADGDRMGKAIDACKSSQEHRALSRSLEGFAQQTRTIVEERHDGDLVYAGGDDVLAFVPLHHLLSCARALAQSFRDRMSSFGFIDDKGELSTPTLSVGIAIVHHVEPLSEGLALVRRAEKAAKKTRNALAIALSKRSGSEQTVAGYWGSIDNRLEQQLALYRHGRIPEGTGYHLRELALTMEPAPAHNSRYADMLRHEVSRILGRRQTGSSAFVETETTNALLAQLDKSSVSVGRLAQELILSRYLQDAIALSEPLTQNL